MYKILRLNWNLKDYPREKFDLMVKAKKGYWKVASANKDQKFFLFSRDSKSIIGIGVCKSKALFLSSLPKEEIEKYGLDKIDVGGDPKKYKFAEVSFTEINPDAPLADTATIEDFFGDIANFDGQRSNAIKQDHQLEAHRLYDALTAMLEDKK